MLVACLAGFTFLLSQLGLPFDNEPHVVKLPSSIVLRGGNGNPEQLERLIGRSEVAPRLTVLTVVFKSKLHIKGLLANVLAQTAFPEIELLLLCPPSPDNEVVFLREFAKAYSNIRVVEFSIDPGLYDLWNFGVKYLARGDYVTTSNVDDRKAVVALAEYINFLDQNPDVDVVCSSVVKTSVPNQAFETAVREDVWWSWISGYLTTDMLFAYNKQGEITRSNNIPHSGPTWRRSIHDRIGYFDEKTYGALGDWEFWLRCLDNGLKIFKLAKPFELYYVDPNSYERRGDPVRKRTLFNLVSSKYSNHPVEAERHDQLHVLVVHEHVPFLEEGGDLRLLQVLESLKMGKHRVTFAYRGWRGKREHVSRIKALVTELMDEEELERVPGSKHDYKLPKNPESFFQRRPAFDAAILATWLYKRYANESLAPSIPEDWMPLLRRFAPQACLATLSDDIHWVRNLEAGYCHEDDKGCGLRLKKAEEEVYRAADVLFTVSDADSAFLTDWLPAPVLGKQPTFLPYVGIPAEERDITGWGERASVLFVGTDHPVNVMALEWFLDRVYPALETAMGGPEYMPKVNIVGRGWAERNMTVRPRVAFSAGLVSRQDLEDYLAEARVFVSPQITGTGISSKNLLALGTGVPLVTTTFGRRGMRFESDDLPAAIRDDPEEFGNAIARVYMNKALWQRMSAAGLRHVARKLSHSVQLQILEREFISCRARLKGHEDLLKVS